MFRLFVFLFLVASSFVQAQVILPVEVLGQPGHIESVKVNLPAGANTVTGLRLKIHGLTAENKASVRVNGSGWMNLNDNSVIYPKSDKGFWGIGGPLSTVRVVLPLASTWVKNGANVIQFRFNDRDGQSIGYRVLELNFVANNKDLIPKSAFVEDNPKNWRPPINTPQAIAAGKKLWYTGSIMQGSQRLRVSCTDCHAHDGRDLKYFNYSNKSIIERALYHKLTRRDGENLASYIRSLNVPYEEKGRPWNPPYQPGPGLDAKPVRSWAAGAGLDWVLDNDLTTLNYLFPNGPRVGAVDYKRTVNAREIPLAIQFPDWNHWLPQIHPLDAFPNLLTPDHSYVRIYTTLREKLKGLKPGVEAGRYMNSQKSNWDRAGQQIGLVKPAATSPLFADFGFRNKGIAHWRVVKTWELMTEFQMEDVGHELWDNTINDRRWFHGEVFRLSPHMMGLPKGKGYHTESMQWYQVQLVLHDGNRSNGSVVPIDWGYLHALNYSSWVNPANLPTYGIAVLNMIKAGEVGENKLPLKDTNGWKPLKQNLTYLAPGNILKNHYNSIDVNIRRRVAEAILTPWLDKAESYSRNEYIAAGHLKVGVRAAVYDLALNLGRLGVDKKLTTRLCNFGQRMWPEISWTPVRPK